MLEIFHKPLRKFSEINQRTLNLLGLPPDRGRETESKQKSNKFTNYVKVKSLWKNGTG